MGILRLSVFLIVALCVPSVSHAARVQVTSATQFLWYPDYLSPEQNQRDLAESLRLNAVFGPNDNVSVHGYGRVLHELRTSVEERPELADDVIGRLYYLYLDYNDLLPDHLDMRAGRSYLATAAVPGILDGLILRGRNLGVDGFGVSAFGGHRGLLDNKSDVSTDRDALFGGSVFYETVRSTYVEASYARDYRDGYLSREVAAIDFTTTPHSLLSLFGRGRYDIELERYDEILAGVKLVPIEQLVLRGEFYTSQPTFDAFSFYSFFDVGKYTQYTLGAEFRPIPVLGLTASYARESFDGEDDADVFGAGVSLRPIPAATLDASYEHREGFAGKLSGFRVNGSYRIRAAALHAGMDFDDFRKDETFIGTRRGDARRYWAGAQYDFARWLRATVRAERNESFVFDPAYQGVVALDVNI